MGDTNQPTIPVPPDEFHIGITMAGAASAGCYTAGAMDYLFEIFDLWQKAKEKNLPPEWGSDIYKYVPQHKVIIDAMGGTSAGGMTTVMAAIYAIKGFINPVNKPEEKNKKKKNVFYDSWVLMGDEEDPKKPKLFEKTFATKDLDETGKIQSLLNSEFIDNICNDAFADDVPQKKRPVYISEQLEVILSHTMLRSVPLAINFTTPFGQLRVSHDNPEHNTFDHFTVSHFKLNYNIALHKDKYLPLDPFGQGAGVMKLATKATGAFPVGLKFREFVANELSTAYIQNTAEQIVFDRVSDSSAPGNHSIKWPSGFPNPFPFISIDGGTINNEPFGEVLNVLKRRYGPKAPGENYKYALIMIDPFPDIVSPKKYNQPDDLFGIVPAIMGTLMDQAKVKRAEMLDAYSNEYYRGEIFPARWKKTDTGYVREDYPIACGASMAFSGFFDIDFRHHDFFLGRDNARNFYRTYFTLEYKKDADPAKSIIHPIHQSWTAEMVEFFKMERDGKVFLPIIPDLIFLKEKMANTYMGPYTLTVKDWPQFDAEKIFSLKPKIETRVKKMLDITYKKFTSGKEETEAPGTTKLVAQNYKGNWWKRFTGWIGSGVLRLLFNLTKGKIASRAAKSAIEWILKDLETSGMLKK
jgi:hypothetical protein